MNFLVPREKNFTIANFDVVVRAEKLFFYHEIFSQDHLYINNICAKILRLEDLDKKRYSKSTNMCSCEKNFTTTNFDTFPRIEFFFLP